MCGNTRTGRSVNRLWICGLLGIVLAGCSTTGAGQKGADQEKANQDDAVPNEGTWDADSSFWSRLGFRPDTPDYELPEDEKASCKDYTVYTRYALDLEEAYRTRTTQNRTWIYVAGILGLGVAAASGALAAATAVAAGTLAVLAISGGFSSAAFATINNSELANVYNVAANEIGSALTAAHAQVIRDHTQCADALATLMVRVSNARNVLDTARTNSAEGALIRAAAGQAQLKELIALQQDEDPTRAPGQSAVITQIDGQKEVTVDIPAAGKLVTLTVEHARFEMARPENIKVAIGPKEDLATDGFPTDKGENTWEVKVMVPGKAPGAEKEYAPGMVVERRRIPSNPKLILKYPEVP